MSIDVPGESLARPHAAPYPMAGAPNATPPRTGRSARLAAPMDIVVFSHLRWDFVYQRPHHLLGRAARDRRVFYVEEPAREGAGPELRSRASQEGVTVVVPVVPKRVKGDDAIQMLAVLMDRFVRDTALRHYTAWYYTPMALAYTRRMKPAAVVFDAMDELSAFRSPPAGLIELEAELLRRADIVFTGGRSLHEAKSARHANAHLFPSSVDVLHFARARGIVEEPPDQAAIPHPRLGYFGVIDERMDLGLIRAIARARPSWQLVMIGPVVKIDAAELPQEPNIHWLGRRDYAELPRYLNGWDVALMPFAHNESTRFISPTKTPEYLAAGRPVVSTSIRDVVVPYGKLGLVRIADEPTPFVEAVQAAMAAERGPWLRRVDEFLGDISWDRTWQEMDRLLDGLDRSPVEAD